jgi:cell division inhibitor SepF
MAGALADVTGVETIKTLVACLGVPDFTIDELAGQAGVSRRTVDTVVRRYRHAFDRLPVGKQQGPGRPPVRWRLRTDHLDEVRGAVGSHQAALGAGWRSQVADAPGPDMVESSLMMAATAITRSRERDDPEQAKQLVAAARNSLAAAGFGSDGSPWTGHPDQELAGRARLIAAVADVVESSLSGDQLRTAHRDASLSGLIPQVAEYLAEQPAGEFDAEAGWARFLTWLVRQTEQPGTPVGAKVYATRDRTRPKAGPGLSTYAGGSPTPTSMRKMAVYLGLIEDDHPHDQYAYDSYEEYEDYDQADTLDAAAEDEARTGQHSEHVPQPADFARITTLHPRTYNEARTIGEHFREGTPVIMNLTEMVDSDAKRLVDFAAGLIFGLRGSIERVTNKVFLLSPANVEVTAEDKARIAERGFFNQSL